MYVVLLVISGRDASPKRSLDLGRTLPTIAKKSITTGGDVNRKKFAHTCHEAPKTGLIVPQFDDLPSFSWS